MRGSLTKRLMNNKAEEETQQNMREKNESAVVKVIQHFTTWKLQGKMCSEDKQPRLGKDAAVVIVGLLLSRCVPKEKREDYKTMKKCNKWIGRLAWCDTSWDDKMKAVINESCQTTSASSTSAPDSKNNP